MRKEGTEGGYEGGKAGEMSGEVEVSERVLRWRSEKSFGGER